MFFGNSIPASIFASQNLNFFGDDPTLYRNFLVDPRLNGPVSPLSRIGPDLTFSRPTSASFWTSLSTINYIGNNIPRFSFYRGQQRGLQVEDQRANLIPYSTDFTITQVWEPVLNSTLDEGLQPGITVTLNQTQAPDNTNTASLLRDVNNTGFHTFHWRQGTEVIDKVLYSRSIFIKKQTARYIVFSCAKTPYASNVTRIFDFNLPGFVAGDLVGTTFEDVGNGWFKIVIDRAATNSNTNKLCLGVCSGPSVAAATYTPGSTLSGVYIWGAQVERGDSSTSYIPTSGTSVIRAADAVSINRPSFKKVYNINESTFYIQASRSSLNVNTPLASVFGNGNQYWNLNTNSLVLSSLVGNIDPLVTIQSIPPIINLTPNYPFNIAIGLQKNNSVIYQNQTLVKLLTSVRIPSIANRFEIGNFESLNFLNGNIQVIGYWPRRFANSVIANLNGQSNAV